MLMIKTRDNNGGQPLKCLIEDAPEEDVERAAGALRGIANKTLKELHEKSGGALLVFPPNFEKYGDGVGDLCLCKLDSDGKLATGNLMGFVGVGGIGMAIGSRFDGGDDHFFLQYMLERVLSLNLLDWKTGAGDEDIFRELLMALFPWFLERAMRQGIFKEYITRRHNNANIKGAVDIARHLKANLPFMGKVAYNTREHSMDNRVTQLIRHTIEFLAASRHRPQMRGGDQAREDVQAIRGITPNYHRRERQDLVNQNIRRVSHPYYTEYEPLRHLCRQILCCRGLSIGKDRDRVHGLVFDGAWLWEEYLNTVLGPLGFAHPRNKESRDRLCLFEGGGGNRWIYPDFYYKEKKIVIDAKYKRLKGQDTPGREDLYQLVTYMYRLSAGKGILLYPREANAGDLGIKIEDKSMHQDSLGGTDAKVGLWGFPVPQDAKGYKEFSEAMGAAEGELANGA